MLRDFMAIHRTSQRKGIVRELASTQFYLAGNNVKTSQIYELATFQPQN